MLGGFGDFIEQELSVELLGSLRKISQANCIAEYKAVASAGVHIMILISSVFLFRFSPDFEMAVLKTLALLALANLAFGWACYEPVLFQRFLATGSHFAETYG